VHAANGTVRLFLETHGERRSPAVLVVRGYGRTSRHSQPFLRALSRRFFVIAMDNRGIGRSSAPLPPYSTRAMADDAAAVLDVAGVPRAHVFGASLGGMIAQRLALDHPSRVDRLVLGCTRSGWRSAARTDPRAAFGLLSTLALPVEVAIERSAPLVLSRAYLAAHPEIVDEWLALARSLPLRRRGLFGQLAAGALHDATRELGRIAARTLVLHAGADRVFDAECSAELARRIPEAELVTLPELGHDFPTEDREGTAAILERFFGA
jgi:pimeloyl-ACP methyl ester carboxylesterase